jgi:hypothetical protein
MGTTRKATKWSHYSRMIFTVYQGRGMALTNQTMSGYGPSSLRTLADSVKKKSYQSGSRAQACHSLERYRYSEVRAWRTGIVTCKEIDDLSRVEESSPGGLWTCRIERQHRHCKCVGTASRTPVLSKRLRDGATTHIMSFSNTAPNAAGRLLVDANKPLKCPSFFHHPASLVSVQR